MSEQWHGGKGSKPRPFSVNQKTYSDNWDAIFGKKENKEKDIEEKEDKKDIEE